MKKLIILLYISPLSLYSQVGINTENPVSTLDVVVKKNDGTTAEGVIAPRLTGDQIKAADSKYGAAQKGTVIYAIDAVSGAGTTKTQHITSEGYYYFDGTVWIPFPGLALNGLHRDGTAVKLGGAITEPTSITGLTDVNKLSIIGTGRDMFNIGNDTFSVNANQNRTGIGTASPTYGLDIEGTARLSQTNSLNKPTQINGYGEFTPLYIANGQDGQIKYAPKGFTSVNGGDISGSSQVIATFPKDNTIVRVRFTLYVDSSSNADNAEAQAYTYGEFAIIGTTTNDKIHFVHKDIKGSDGLPKTLTANTSTSIDWSQGSQGDISITINQSTGELSVNRTNASAPPMKYFFEILGGI